MKLLDPKAFSLLAICLQFESNASKIHSSLALGLCMKKKFPDLIDSNLKDGNVFMKDWTLYVLSQVHI